MSPSGKDDYPFIIDCEAYSGELCIYVTETTMLRLLGELKSLRELVTRLQKRGTELVEENRKLKKELNK